MTDRCGTSINLTIHVLWLAESLLLRRAMPVMACDPAKIHLAVEQLRPDGCGRALKIALKIKNAEPKSEVKEEISKLFADVLKRNRLPESLIKDGDVEKVYLWLDNIRESSYCHSWTGGREMF